MELNELIRTRQASNRTDDQITRMLLGIVKLDTNRADNLFRLRNTLLQIENQLDTTSNDADVSMKQWLAVYRSQLDADLEQLRQQFGADLADCLNPLGLKLKGQYPKLHAGLFTFILDFDKGKCRIWYGPEQEALVDVLLSATKVFDAVRKQQAQLGSGLDPDELVARAREAYLHACLRHGEGTLRLTDLLSYMALMVQQQRFRADPRKKNYRDYGRADFSFDLYRMRNESLPFRLSIATRQQTRSRKDFLWVPAREDVESGDYFATIELKETES